MAKQRETELEPLDAALAAQLESARAVEPVEAERRAAIRERLQQKLGPLEDAETPTHGGASRSRATLVVAAALLASAAALVLWTLSSPTGPAPAGQLEGADQRVTMSIGAAAVAVAEPATRMSWGPQEQGVRVVQKLGRVFYRVEADAALEVQTPHGRVVVEGTSFEVEIAMKTSQKAKHLTIGASIAAATIVTVYEGKAQLTNDRGSQLIEAGETSSIAGTDAPAPPRSRSSREGSLASIDATSQRSRDDRVELENMRRQVSTLERALAEAEKTAGAEDPGFDEELDFVQRLYDPTPEQAREAAKECSVQYAVPQLGGTGAFVTDAQAELLGLDPAERERLEKGFVKLDAARVRTLRELYAEVTGNDADVDQLSNNALFTEIRDKVTPEERTEARERVSLARAGMGPAMDPAEASPMERLYQSELGTARESLALVRDVVGNEEGLSAIGELNMMMRMENGCGTEPAPPNP